MALSIAKRASLSYVGFLNEKLRSWIVNARLHRQSKNHCPATTNGMFQEMNMNMGRCASAI